MLVEGGCKETQGGFHIKGGHLEGLVDLKVLHLRPHTSFEVAIQTSRLPGHGLLNWVSIQVFKLMLSLQFSASFNFYFMN